MRKVQAMKKVQIIVSFLASDDTPESTIERIATACGDIADSRFSMLGSGVHTFELDAKYTVSRAGVVVAERQVRGSALAE